MAALSTAITAATAIAGIGTAAYGLSEQQKNQKRLEAAAAGQNRAYAGQAQASVEASQASQRAEAARKQQMELDATRATRQAIRAGIVNRAIASARATGRGAGESSVAQGAQFQIAGQAASNQLAIQQNLGIGRQIFQANQDVLSAQIKAAQFGSTANFYGTQIQSAQSGINYGQSIFNLGANIASTSETVGRIGSSIFSPGVA